MYERRRHRRSPSSTARRHDASTLHSANGERSSSTAREKMSIALTSSYHPSTLADLPSSRRNSRSSQSQRFTVLACSCRPWLPNMPASTQAPCPTFRSSHVQRVYCIPYHCSTMTNVVVPYMCYIWRLQQRCHDDTIWCGVSCKLFLMSVV